MKKEIKILKPSVQIKKALNRLNTRSENDVSSYGVVFLDNYLWGIEKGELVVIWGNTGNWKTELSYQMAMENIELWRKVLLVGVEGEEGDFYNRIIYRKTREETGLWIVESRLNKGADTKKIKSIRKKYARILKEQLEEKFIYLDNTQITTWWDVELAVEQLKTEEFVPDLIIVDHLHYILDETKQELGEITQTMKNIQIFIKKKQIWLVLFSHVNRSLWEARPRLHELHWSSSIEKIAFTVIMIHKRDREDDDQVSINAIWNEEIRLVTEFNILKSRKWLWQLRFCTVFDPNTRRFLDNKQNIWVYYLDDTDDGGELLNNLNLSFTKFKKKVEQKEKLPLNDELPVETKEIKLDDEWDPILTLN